MAFIFLILITFAPRMYEGLPLLPSASEIARLLDPVAVATVLLAAATYRLVIDSSKNIEISRNNLLEGHLIKEMEELIKPIYMEQNKFEYLEFVHIPYHDETKDFQRWTEEAHDFWDRLEADRYLTSKNLREMIQDYSQINKEWLKKQEEIASRINEALTREGKRELCEEAPRDRHFDCWPGYFDYRFINLPPSNDKAERKQKIRKLTDRLDPKSDSYKLIEEFVKLIDEDTVLEDKRTIFKANVINRYEELEKKISEIREGLEKAHD